MNRLIKIKRFLFDKRNKTSELYRPFIYWYYILNPFKKTGKVNFLSLEEIFPLLLNLNVELKNFELKRSDLEKYMSDHTHEYWHYYSTGYGTYFVGKSAEHYISISLSHFLSGTFIDIASADSPFYKIIKKLYPMAKVYQQDLLFRDSNHEDKIGGTAIRLPISDKSVDLMTLHNSIEHFEGKADRQFILECARVLKKDGEVIMLPIFLGKEHLNYINPTINPQGLKTDTDTKKIYVYGSSRFMRQYSADTFRSRILEPAKDKFKIELYRIILSEDFIENIELAVALRLVRL